MRYFKDSKDNVYGFDDDAVVDESLKQIDEDEVKSIVDSKLASYIPTTLTAYQVRKVLTAKGLRDSVEEAIKDASLEVQDAWNYAATFDRAHEFIETIGAVLGLDDEQLDELFIDGVKL